MKDLTSNEQLAMDQLHEALEKINFVMTTNSEDETDVLGELQIARRCMTYLRTGE